MRHWRLWQRSFVILLAVLSICVHVSSRTFQGCALAHRNIQSYPPHAKHQHLNADAFELVYPVSTLAMLLPAAKPDSLAQETRIRLFGFAECLSNRPPPAFSLL